MYVLSFYYSVKRYVQSTFIVLTLNIFSTLDAIIHMLPSHIQWCALKFGQLLFQDSGKTIHGAEINDTLNERAAFSTEMRQKKIQNGRLKKFKMADSKKPHFPAPSILNIFL